MSKKRMAELPPLVKGSDGRYLCRWCQGAVPRPRRTFCSEACVHDYNIRANPGYARMKTFERDKGVCVMCNLDTQALFGFNTPEYLEAKEKAEYYRKRSDELRGLWYETNDQGIWDQLKAHDDDWMSHHKAQMAFTQLHCTLRDARAKELIADGWPASRVHGGSLWDMDHIKPVIEGGGECGLDNLRTLCIKCHKKETAALRKRMKEAKLNAPSTD